MEEEVLALMILAELLCEDNDKNEKRKKRKKWMKKERFKDSENLPKMKLFKRLQEDYLNRMRMDKETYDKLLKMISPFIEKKDTLMREAIPADVRLSITLRFLAEGVSFESIKSSYEVSAQAIGKIVIEACEAIITVLKDYIKTPKTAEEWKEEANNFQHLTGFPNCLGTIDGKHVRIQKSKDNRSNYFKYKTNFSIILSAIVNSNSEFLMIDTKASNRLSSDFIKKIESNELNLPESSLISENLLLPYVFVGNENLPLTEYLMKPYTKNYLKIDQQLFNWTLNSAMSKNENAFSILFSRFKILTKTINLCPEKAAKIIMCCCYLHNYLIKTRGFLYSEESLFKTEDDCDINQHSIKINEPNNRNSSNLAISIRDKFSSYISSF